MMLDDALRDLAAAGNDLPRPAMQWALDNWDEARPRFLALLDGYVSGEDTSERTQQALFFVLHLLAERRETAAFAPLCRLLHDAEAADLVLGEALTSTLAGLLINTFDGDGAALRALVEAEAADEIVRCDALLVLAYLTRTGRLPEADMRAFLRRLPATMQPQGVNLVWFGWAMAAGKLGYADLTAEAEALFRGGFVAADMMEFADFRDELRLSRNDPTGMAGFVHDGIVPFTDAIGELDKRAAVPGGKHDGWDAADSPEPFVNPLRGVGRNDPCPCGSGRKFKKCCLA